MCVEKSTFTGCSRECVFFDTVIEEGNIVKS